MSKNFSVNKTGDGRGGWIIYNENSGQLRFAWELIVNGFTIYTPHPSHWDGYCEKKHTEWAKNRRKEILEHIAEYFIKSYGYDTYQITDMGIDLYAKPFLSSFFSKLFRIK